MLEGLKKIWRSFNEWHKKRLVVSVWFMDKEEYEKATEEIFSSGKRLSDFLAMILRASFAVIVAKYFDNKADSAVGLKWFIYVECSLAFYIISLFMIINIVTITYLYYAGEVVQSSNSVGKLISLAFCVLVSALFLIGLNDLVQDLASVSGIIPQK